MERIVNETSFLLQFSKPFILFRSKSFTFISFNNSLKMIARLPNRLTYSWQGSMVVQQSKKVHLGSTIPAFGCCTLQMLVEICFFHDFCMKNIKKEQKVGKWGKAFYFTCKTAFGMHSTQTMVEINSKSYLNWPL